MATGWNPGDPTTVMTRVSGTNNYSFTLDLYEDTQWKLVINQSWDAGQVSPSSPGVTIQEDGVAIANFATVGGTNMEAVGDGFDGLNFNTKVNGSYTISFTSLPALSRILNITRNGNPIVPPPTNIDWFLVGDFTNPNWGEGFVAANQLTQTGTVYTKTLDLLIGNQFKLVRMAGTIPTWNGASIKGTVLPVDFELGIGGSDNFEVTINGNYSVTIDDSVTPVKANFVRLGNPIVTPPAVTYDLPEWRVFKNDWAGSAASHQGVDGELVMTVENASFSSAPADNWQLQVIQDAFAPHFGGADNQGHMQMVAGKSYRVSFDAKASVAGNITLAIGHAVGAWTPYHTASLAVTTTMKEFTSEFTLDAAGTFTTPAQFKLEMGNLFSGAVAGSTFTLDNVLIEEKVNTDYVSTDLIVNGEMDKVVYFTSYSFVGAATGAGWNNGAAGFALAYDATKEEYTFKGLVLTADLFRITITGTWGGNIGFSKLTTVPTGFTAATEDDNIQVGAEGVGTYDVLLVFVEGVAKLTFTKTA
jgi:hypothetical protein